MKENLFEIIFQLSGMWFYVGGKEENNIPTEITYVAVLEDSINRYVKIHYDPKIFREDFALLIQAQLEEQKKNNDNTDKRAD